MAKVAFGVDTLCNPGGSFPQGTFQECSPKRIIEVEAENIKLVDATFSCEQAKSKSWFTTYRNDAQELSANEWRNLDDTRVLIGAHEISRHQAGVYFYSNTRHSGFGKRYLLSRRLSNFRQTKDK